MVEKVIWAFYQPLDLTSNALLGGGVEKSGEEMKANRKQHRKCSVLSEMDCVT